MEDRPKKGEKDGAPVRFSRREVERHIKLNHPGCSRYHANEVAQRVACRVWFGITLGRAVGIMMQAYLRHEKTQYDSHIANGVDRSAARKQVRGKLNGVVARWAKAPQEMREAEGAKGAPDREDGRDANGSQAGESA